MPSNGRPNVLYVQVQGSVWPHGLPHAESYVAVRRIEPTETLTPQLSSRIARNYQSLVRSIDNHVRLDGLQIDYDCPTERLASYGRFLMDLHRELPPGALLSITALLDWFGPHTSIQAALDPVDEFVPQFYDIGTSRAASGIGVPIDPVHWAPVLNALKTPYRIGISSFGRISRRRQDDSGRWIVQYFRDASPLDFAGRRELKRSVESTASGETVVHYEVMAPLPEIEDVRPGDVIEITLPTAAAVHAAYDAVQQFGGYCAGMIFFRWPNRSETLALSFDEVSQIISSGTLPSGTRLETSDVHCIERKCSDLYLHLGREPAITDQMVQLRAQQPIDLFIPNQLVHSVSIGANRILVRVPAFSGMESIYLGRAVSSAPLKFEVSTR